MPATTTVVSEPAAEAKSREDGDSVGIAKASRDSLWTVNQSRAIARPYQTESRPNGQRIAGRKTKMKFVATVLLAIVVAGPVLALHPPVGPTPGDSTPGGSTPGGGTGRTTSVTPTSVPSPEPAAATLALLGLIGGGTVRLLRRKR
jgi:hypothetical protein